MGVANSKGPGEEDIQELKDELNQVFGTSPTDMTITPGVHTELDAKFLENWRRAANDPDTEVPQWLVRGSPAGITSWPKDKGICPAVEGDPAYDVCMANFSEDFSNYKSVGEDSDAEEEITKLGATDYLDVYGSLNEVLQAIGAPPTVSKLALIKNIINDKKKLRLILDCLQSGVNSATTQIERSGQRFA